MIQPQKKVKIELIRQGMTQKELATITGITEEYLSKIIAGKNIPSVKIAMKISEILETKVENIFHYPE